MSYYQDEFYEADICGQCGCEWQDCECEYIAQMGCPECGHQWEFCRCHCDGCSHCGESYEDCMCHLIDSDDDDGVEVRFVFELVDDDDDDDDGTQAEGVPFA